MLSPTPEAGVPPFRISLQPRSAELAWQHGDAVATLTAGLEAEGYRAAGDYVVPEMSGVSLRGFVNPTSATVAALYEHPRVAHPLLDLLRLHTDRRHVLATTAPEDGLDAPPHKTVRRHAPAGEDEAAVRRQIAAMHAGLMEDSGGSAPLAIAPRLFPMLFTTAYAAEMDWRIQRGGVTAEEVAAAALAGGQEAPDGDDVEHVREMWRYAIEEFISEEVQRAFLAAGTLSAAQWEQVRDRVLVVHERVHREGLIEEIAEALLQDDDGAEDDGAYDRRYEALTASLRPHLSGDDPIEGFRAACAQIGEMARYRHLGDVSRPWRAALYVRPE
jgi:hypothetical protein